VANKKYTPNTLLRRARELQNLNQKELADKLETTALNVGRWERGEVFPGNYYRLKLCEFFNQSDEDLGLIREWYHASNAEEDFTQSAPDTEQEENLPVLPPVPPTQKNPLRKKRWLSVAIVTCVVLLGIVGGMIIPKLWHPNSPPFRANTAASGTAITPCAAAPTLTDPVDGQMLNSRTVTMTWEAPQGCLPDGYTVRISANYDPEAKPWIVDTGWAPTYYKYTFSTDGSYYWHIRACKPCTPFHPGNWAIRIFTILTASTP